MENHNFLMARLTVNGRFQKLCSISRGYHKWDAKAKPLTFALAFGFFDRRFFFDLLRLWWWRRRLILCWAFQGTPEAMSYRSESTLWL